jgi:hypothetical protein
MCFYEVCFFTFTVWQIEIQCHEHSSRSNVQLKALWFFLAVPLCNKHLTVILPVSPTFGMAQVYHDAFDVLHVCSYLRRIWYFFWNTFQSYCKYGWLYLVCYIFSIYLICNDKGWPVFKISVKTIAERFFLSSYQILNIIFSYAVSMHCRHRRRLRVASGVTTPGPALEGAPCFRPKVILMSMSPVNWKCWYMLCLKSFFKVKFLSVVIGCLLFRVWLMYYFDFKKPLSTKRKKFMNNEKN